MPSVVLETQMLDQLASELAVVKSARQPAPAQVCLLLFRICRCTLSLCDSKTKQSSRSAQTTLNCRLGLTMCGRIKATGQRVSAYSRARRLVPIHLLVAIVSHEERTESSNRSTRLDSSKVARNL